MPSEQYPLDPVVESLEEESRARRLMINLRTMADTPENNVAYHIAKAENARIDVEDPNISNAVREQIALDQSLYE